MNPFIDRDLSWLAFNERVLQEAESEANPVLERLKFLAIFSSNLEEFYKVRVARQRFYAFAKINKTNKFGYKPTEILKKIYRKVDDQQVRFGKIYHKSILPELRRNEIVLVQNLNKKSLREKALELYKKIAEHVEIIPISKEKEVFLKNQVNYLLLVTKKKVKYNYFLIEIDSDVLSRFHIDQHGEKTNVFMVDDLIRAGMKEEFGEQYFETYAIKLSRDAELYLDDEPIDKDFKQKLKDSLKKRDSGIPSRLLFDELIPYRFLNEIMVKTNSDREALIPGGRYHRFYDFFGFPKFEKPQLYFHAESSIRSEQLVEGKSMIDQILKQDVFLSFPYQDYNYIVELLKEAAESPRVKQIQITLYRVAKDSLICQHLEQAIKNGKEVIVYTELKARFDESSNLYWNKRLREAGAKIYDEVKGLKTHAKIFQIELEDGAQRKKIAHLGTGNFNEKTAEIYTDFSLLTANHNINQEVTELFKFLTGHSPSFEFNSLLAAPYGLRRGIKDRIKREIDHAKKGHEASLMLKVNSLEDTEMIELLYEASQQGVKIDLIVRGICCLKAGVKGLSENINAVSIVGRYLEHSRIYYFKNNGQDEVYCSSADLMERNLDKRVEVGFPLLNKKHKDFLLSFLDQQLSDTKKARILDEKLKNKFQEGNEEIEAQKDIRALLKAMQM